MFTTRLKTIALGLVVGVLAAPIAQAASSTKPSAAQISRLGAPANHDAAPLAVALGDVVFSNATPTCPAGVTTFPLSTLDGAPAGTGISCNLTNSGCDPFSVPCLLTTEAVLTFNLAGGSITARATYYSTFTSESALSQVAIARIRSGTGPYAGAHGLMVGTGTLTFTDTAVKSTLIYAVLLRTSGNHNNNED